MAAAMLPDTFQKSIYSQAEKCQHLFRQYIENHLDKERQYKNEVTRCYNRFLTWASFLGVFAKATISLDRRLQYEPEIKDLALSMLSVLEINLKHGLEKHQLVSARSTTDVASGVPKETRQNDGVMFGITGAIDRLDRLAKAIRHAPRLDEVERVRSFVAKLDVKSEASFSSLVSAMIRYIFPKADETLRIQLAESVIYRRHRLLYNRRHSQKLARPARVKAAHKPTLGEAKVSGTAPQWNLQLGERMSGSRYAKTEDTLSSSAPSRRPIGAAPQYRPSPNRPDKTKNMPTETGSSILPTARYPSRPKAVADTADVQCPYCLATVKVSSNTEEQEQDPLWIEHVNEDLLPYICVAEDCGALPPAFSSAKDWQIHMENTHGSEWSRLIHRVRWQCRECGEAEKPFLTRDSLVHHLAEDQNRRHATAKNAVEIAAAAAGSQISEPRSPLQCPLCAVEPPWYSPWAAQKAIKADTPKKPNGVENNLQKHFATHLRDLAFYSLYQWDFDTGVDVELEHGSETSEPVGFNSQLDRMGEMMQEGGEIPYWNEDKLHELDLARSVIEQERTKQYLIANRELTSPLHSSQPAPPAPPGPSIPSDPQNPHDPYDDTPSEPPIEPSYTQVEPESLWFSEVLRHLRFSELQDNLREAKKKLLELSSPESDLGDEIFREFVGSTFYPGIHYFLPEGRIQRLVSSDAIIRELPTLDPESFNDVNLFGFIRNEAKKTFAISVLTGFRGDNLMTVMRRFLDDGLNDAVLPIPHPQSHEQDGKISSAFVDKPWSKLRGDKFFRMQWRFLSPIFVSSNSSILNLHPHSVLPFTSSRTGAKMGAFSRVSEARIHPNHLDTILPAIGSHLAKQIEGDHPRIVIKEMMAIENVGHPKGMYGWEDEVMVLNSVAELRHPNIIKSIAAFRMDKRRYLTFEWADGGNLRDVWARSPSPNQLSPRLVKEALVELAGLSDAVFELHEMGIRHGDLKPENILSVEQGDTTFGRLKISDMGLARKHEVRTELRQTGTETRWGTIRYEAPEANMSKAVSRLYDIWSLGCIILEWTIVLLYGYRELEKFTSALLDETLRSSGFFEIAGIRKHGNNPGLDARVHPTVMKVMDTLAKDPECRGDTAFSHLLELVRNRLLVVDLPRRQWSDAMFEATKPPILVVDLETRATALELRNTLNHILKTAEEDENFLFSGLPRENCILNLTPKSSEIGSANASSFTTARQGGLLSSADAKTRVDYVSRIEDYSRPDSSGWEFIIDNDFARQVMTKNPAWNALPNELNPSAVRTSKALCSRCRLVSFWAPGLIIEDEVANLRGSAEGCELCLLLLKACGTRTEGSVVFERHQSTILLNNTSLPVLSIVTTRDPIIASPTQIGLPALPDAGSEMHFSIVREWLKKCDMDHAYCGQPRSEVFTPTRLIDVNEVDVPWVRLHVTKLGDSYRYIALSHSWGDQQLTTLTSSFRQHLDRINIEDLPSTFRDAVITARAVGVGYIWVDSLCVLQDDDVDSTHEAKRIDDVFNNAYCVIAATHTSSANSGFLTHRPPRDFVKVDQYEESELYVCSFIDKFEEDVLQSRLHRRTWNLQQRALARRTIFFAKGQTYWECGDGIRCETLTKMKSNVEAFMSDPNWPIAMTALARSTREKILMFQRLFSRYSQMSLFDSKDRPIAIDGLQKRLAARLGCRGAWGVFDSKFLHASLLWRRAKQVENLRQIYFEADESQPPSWSWTGLEGGISYLGPSSHKVEWSPGLRLEGKDLYCTVQNFSVSISNFDRLIFDFPDGEHAVHEGLKCCEVGRIKEAGQEDGTRPGGMANVFVLFVIPADEILASRQVYRRVGVGALHADCIDPPEEASLIC